MRSGQISDLGREIGAVPAVEMKGYKRQSDGCNKTWAVITNCPYKRPYPPSAHLLPAEGLLIMLKPPAHTCTPREHIAAIVYINTCGSSVGGYKGLIEG